MKKDKLIGIGVNGAKVYESSKHRYWLCQCECGRQETVSEYDLLMGIATMCSVCKSKEEK
jgi:hypothetical protein